MQKHKHYNLIVNWAEGHRIEFFNTTTQEWIYTSRPTWSEETEYRLADVSKQVLYTATWYDEDNRAFEISDELTDYQAHGDNLKLTFDNETKQLIDVSLCLWNEDL